MRIIIDLQGAQTDSRFRGIGRYTLSLAQAIVNSECEHEIILVLNGQFPETIEPIRAVFAGLLPEENIRVWQALDNVSGESQKNTWRRQASERIREAFIASLNPDFILLSTFFEGLGDDFVASVDILNQKTPTAIVLYDLIPLINPDKYLPTPISVEWYQNKLTHCKQAQLLLSISESAGKEAIEHLGATLENVINISSAVDEIFRPTHFSATEQKEKREKFGLSKGFLMYSGATDERKNHLRLISAYSKLPYAVRFQHQLAFVGGLPEEHHSKFLKHAQSCGLRDGELVITGRVTDEEMLILYNLCKAFVFPSWHEGFGLPALEAMSCGRAVIVSNTSSLPEVVGNVDALFDPFNEQSIATKIEQVLTDDAFRSDLELHGLEMSKKFSWEATARKSIKAMESYHKKLGLIQQNGAVDSDSDDSSYISLIESIAELSAPFNDQDLRGAATAIAHNQKTEP